MNNKLSSLRLDEESTDMHNQRLQALNLAAQQVQSREDKYSSMTLPSVGSYEQSTRPTADSKSAAPEKMGQNSSVFLSELSPLNSEVRNTQLLEILDGLLTGSGYQRPCPVYPLSTSKGNKERNCWCP